MSEAVAAGAVKEMQTKRPKEPPVPFAPSGLATDLLGLHDVAGNQAVNELLRTNDSKPPFIQARLVVGAAGDRFEKEADRIAEQVTKISPSSNHDSPTAQRQPNQEAEVLQAKEIPGSALEAPPDLASEIEGLRGKGRPLPPSQRTLFESHMGRDFSQVRLHTGETAAGLASQLNARAFTVGQNIVFAPGQYKPQDAEGRHLLAHELAHVAQQDTTQAHSGDTPVTQTAAPQVQRSIFGDIWEGVKSVGETIGSAVSSAGEWLGERAEDVGRLLSGAAEWAGERLRDASTYVINLIRDLPARLARLATTLWEGLSGVITFLPEAIAALSRGGLKGLADWLWEKAKRGGEWILVFVSRVFDVLGGPEIVEFIWHILTNARPLTGDEIAAGTQVLGPSAVRWGDVRVAEGGVARLIFALNDRRAFVMFHTINLPEGESTDTVVHELTHVFQYEKVGSVYLGGALHAQITRGSGAYDYGGPDGLVAAQQAGQPFSIFNREEQAQIAQDYYRYLIQGKLVLTDEQRQAYEHFITQLRAGSV